MDWDERARLLAGAAARLRARVPDCYDETLREVAARAAETGSLGKADLGALVLWKRLQANTPWAAELVSLPDRVVREHTGAAVRAVREEGDVVEAARRGRRALSPLPGFGVGDALASAVLAATDLGRLPVYDRNAHAALGRLGLPLDHRRGRYARYVAQVEACRDGLRAQGHDWDARQVDLALFQLGRGPAPEAAGAGAG